MQYVQQALFAGFVDGIEGNYYPRSFIDFQDQTPNQRLALKGSIDGSLATLDLSEASDRVSNRLVRELFKRHPHLGEAVDSCRSRKADVPGHGVRRLAKFASMGSALCFPMEAIVFLTIIFLGIERKLSEQKGSVHVLTRRDLKRFVGSVRVYGDDIIVPAEFAVSVASELEAFGLKVNRDKSFWTGRFRESCGKEYYSGFDVSIVRQRSVLPTQQKHVHEIVSTLALRNNLFLMGYEKSVDMLDSILGKFYDFPVVEPTSPSLGKLSHFPHQVDGWDNSLQRPFVKGFVLKPTFSSSKLDGYGALMKFFLKKEELFALGDERIHQNPAFLDGKLDNSWMFPEALDEKHLERAGRPVAVRIKPQRLLPY
jgi:hypothetical protein